MDEKVVKQFTEEEVNRIQELRDRVLTINTRLGEIELNIHELESAFEDLKNQKTILIQEHKTLQQDEQKLGDELRDKYGQGTYDITTNEFTPAQ